MNELWLAPQHGTALDAQVAIPGSKSLTNRWLVLAALASGPSHIHKPLKARDTLLMADALTSLGTAIEDTDTGWLVTPGPLFGPAQVDCGLAGTVMRFVPPVAALANGDIRFDGDPHARVRPMQNIISSLRGLNVVVHDDGRGTLPFTVQGTGHVTGADIELDASASSQFVSALLLAGSRYDGGLTIRHRGGLLPSLPHIDMSIEVLAQVGIRVDVDISDSHNATWVVHPGIPQPFSVTVEPDLSNAAAFLAAALVCGGSVTIPDWPEHTTQAGDHLRWILRDMGATITQAPHSLTATGTGTIHGIDADLHNVGELTPVIAALAALADSPSHLHGIAHLRGHETDRLHALATQINKLGGQVSQTDDGLIITPQPLHGGTFETYDDHRMAMAAVVIGLRVADVKIENIHTTAKTLPQFADMWLALVTNE
ncbi:MAG: 3-phosphoshikimate 1-carboxyvinyltransferase [Actinomycetes bacterium]